MPPSELNSTASYLRQSSQKREAENRSARANLASSSIEPMNETSSAFPWNRGSGVYIVSPGFTPVAPEDDPERAGVVLRGHDALGRAGGARRVHHPDAAARLVEVDVGLGVGAVHQPVEVPVDAVVGLAVEHDRRPQQRAALPHRQQRLPQVLVDDGADGIGVGQDVGQRRPALRRVDRHRVGADEDDAEMGPEELGPVRQQEGHLLARPHAELEEPVGRPLRVGQDVPPGDLLVLPLQPGGVGVVGHPLADRLLDGTLRPSHTDHPFARRMTGGR